MVRLCSRVQTFKGGKVFRTLLDRLFKRPGRGSVTFDMLPDDVLLDRFDFFHGFLLLSIEVVHTSALLPEVATRHLCLATPIRLAISLHAQHTCERATGFPASHHAHHDKQLSTAIWPSQPRGWQPSPSAIENRDRVRWVHLDGITSPLLKKLVGMMQETPAVMELVRLLLEGETVPVLQEAFLGGSCPCLHIFWLSGIPFPQLPRLLLSTGDLVVLRLEKIPHSGYIPCDVMAVGLSTSTKFETPIIEFQSMDPHPGRTGIQPTASLTRTTLPALTLFKFRGHGGVL